MGLIRVILALSVIVAHCGGRFFGLEITDGELAVNSFFVISGFYMGLILSTRYRTQVGSFYFNRFLRLYPTYWIVLAATAAGLLLYRLLLGALPPQVAQWASLPGGWSVWIVLGLANLAILGTDAAFWVRSGTYSGYVADPPIWSVSVEIFFYVLAPAIVAAALPVQVGAFALALALRASLWAAHGAQWSVWTYSFAPAALPLFLAGVLAHRAYARLERSPGGFPLRGAESILTGLFAVAVVLQAGLRHLRAFAPFSWVGPHHWIFYGALAASLPWIFAASKDRPLDNRIANWSYPLYVCHWPVLVVGAPLLALAAPALRPTAAIALTGVFAAGVLGLDQRIQRRFKRRVEGVRSAAPVSCGLPPNPGTEKSPPRAAPRPSRSD